MEIKLTLRGILGLLFLLISGVSMSLKWLPELANYEKLLWATDMIPFVVGVLIIVVFERERIPKIGQRFLLIFGTLIVGTIIGKLLGLWIIGMF